MKNRNFNKGVALLLAVLIMTIVSAISFGFSAFIIKELNISAIGRESMKALFASDSGADCAFYWEFKRNAFATTTISSTITCANSTEIVRPKDDWDSGATTTFQIRFNNGSCAEIGINKKAYPPLYDKYRIVSYGRNIGDDNCNSISPNRVERALKIEF